MKRGTFRKKSYEEVLGAKQASIQKRMEKRATGQISGNERTLARVPSKPKRKKKSPLKKLKETLWQLCREITIKRYGSDCYTCPSKALSGSNRHLGHFISSSVCSTELRYSLDNLRIQCYSCNIHKSGNWLAYEKHLIQDGINPQVLKDRNEATKGGMYREDFYLQKIEEYKQYL